MQADLVARIHDHLHLLAKGLDGVSGDEPGGLQAELIEELGTVFGQVLTVEDLIAKVSAKVAA